MRTPSSLTLMSMRNPNPEQNGLTAATDGRSEMMLVLANMSNILNDLQVGFTQLDESAESFARLPSRSRANQETIPALSQRIAENDVDRAFNEIKLKLSDEITQQVAISVK
ncbi:hypothetical protein M413DRAFT_175557 [Hebeloma cylindrosporum]|uniref:Uncharacterized protein n=1 Tax=Hebeloma cylindrosporum TaxID=76867 RepID=A0A0C2YGN6_HEBCY|nr:hypothetical protein M413DRAFT_175557 [Hebeloma cylindrosporum h7]